MKIKTERLILRQLTPKDARDIAKNINDLEVSKYLAVVPYPYSIKDAKSFINNCQKKIKEKSKTGYDLGIELKSEKKIIGGMGLHHINQFNGTAELGYWLGKNYWRQGIGSEAVSGLINYAFNKLKLRRLTIPAFVENNASNGLARKLGFKYEGKLRKSHKAKSTGKIHDSNIYGLLKEDWIKRRGKLK